jgi:hypothetical protein
MTEGRYADPAALRRAVTDRLRTLARDQHAQLADLQRQFAYDRLLARLFVSEPDRWVLKGATALLARLGGAARHTLDVDLYRPGERLVETEAALRAAAASDLGDFLRFALAPGRRVAEGRDTIRIAVNAYLGATEFATFHVDLIAGIVMTGEPDEVRPLVPLALPGIPAPNYRVYPIADHVADKLCALLETHPRATGPAQPSTRYRDLADLAVIAHTQPLDAELVVRAVASEARRRRLTLPDGLPTPDAARWRPGYARVARDVPGLVEQDLNDALVTVRQLVDPILSRSATGTWDPAALSWGDRTWTAKPERRGSLR